jgi:hypothetical protein
MLFIYFIHHIYYMNIITSNTQGTHADKVARVQDLTFNTIKKVTLRDALSVFGDARALSNKDFEELHRLIQIEYRRRLK